MTKFIDLTGYEFGRLKVINLIEIRNHKAIWNCKCSCGNKKEVATNHLRDGHIRSCGCLRNEMSSKRISDWRSHNNPYHKESGWSSKNQLYRMYARKAKSRGLNFYLTKDQFFEITSGCCYYCGIKPLQKTGRKDMYGKYIYNGIDRVDNSKGYILGNCVPCCMVCNRAKSDMSLEEFYHWIDRISTYKES